MEALSLLIKPASGNCNMRCQYCFYCDVAQNREVEDRGMMDTETLRHVVQNALSEATQFVSFGFQGGEPMLAGLDFFESLMAFEREYNQNRVEIYNSIQTNGTLIDGAWADFFAKNNFLVGLSIDGTKDLHDMLRPDAAGKGTHNRCMKAAATLARAGAEYNVLSVVTKGFAAHPEQAYHFYKKNGFRFIQLIPCMDGLEEAHGENPYSLTGEQYGRFLCRLFDLWYEDFIAGDYTSFRNFDNYVRMLMGQEPENCGMAGRCQAYPVIEADGMVYPCDFYVLDGYQIGDVHRDSFGAMLQGEAAVHFMEPSYAVPPECTACAYHFICRCGCRRDREPLADGHSPANCYCEGYKAFFAHALPRMAELARRMPR